MPTITATVGASDANSFVTLSDAEAYFTTRLHYAAWTAATQSQKEAALIWAGRLINHTVRFNGTKTDSDQSMSWPRSGLTDNGEDTPSDSIPEVIKNIQCDLSLLLLSTDRTLENDASVQGLTSLKAGPVALGFKDNIAVPRAVPDTLIAMLPVEWVWRAVPYPLVVG